MILIIYREREIERGEREREVCVCVWERERERERDLLPSAPAASTAHTHTYTETQTHGDVAHPQTRMHDLEIFHPTNLLSNSHWHYWMWYPLTGPETWCACVWERVMERESCLGTAIHTIVRTHVHTVLICMRAYMPGAAPRQTINKLN